MDGKLTQVLLAMTAVALVSGCASLPRCSQISGQSPKIAPDQGRIYFYRGNELAWGRAGLTTKIRLNDRTVGSLNSGCFFYADRSAGDYFVGCQTRLWDAEQGKHKLTFTLNTGETKYARLTKHSGVVTADAETRLEDKASAIQTLSGCHYTAQK